MDLPSIAPSMHRQANYGLPQITDGTTTGTALGAAGFDSGPTAKQPKHQAPPPAPPAAGPPPPPPPPGGV